VRPSSASNTPTKIFGSTISTTLTTVAPTTVQLGAALPATCAFRGTLSNTTFFQLCEDTGTLKAYPAATAIASGTLTGVLGSLIPLPGADRVAFRKTDGNLYSAANTGALGADVAAIATKGDLSTTILQAGNYVLYRDSVKQLSRISKADGSVIDEPLFDCDVTYSGQVYMNASNTQLFAPSARCGTISFGLLHAPVANLP
jgi:hypothetical protein